MQGRGLCHLGALMPSSPPPPHHCFPISLIIVISPPSPHHPWPSCFPFTPCEQLLVMVVGGLVVMVIMIGDALPSPGHHGHHTVAGAGLLPVILSWLPALHHSVVHPASRASQWQCGHRVPSHVLSAGGVAMWQGVPYLVVIPLPWALWYCPCSLTSHLHGEERMGGPCCWKVVVT